MQKSAGIWLLVILSLIMSVFALFTASKNNRPHLEGATSRAEIVLERQSLRVGYLVLPPLLSKNESNGELSGPIYDFVNKIGENLSLEVDWVEEANLATLSAGLDSQRYDMIGFPLWENADRGKRVDFTVPLFYSPVGAYVRADDTRFDTNLATANNSSITIAAIDGELAGAIAASDFPLAKVEAKPQLVDYSQLLLEVATNKADMTFYNDVFARKYIDQNPGKVKRVPTNRPVRLYAETLILPEGDYRFKQLIDTTINELINHGVLEAVFRNNNVEPSDYYLRALPFEEKP